MNPSEIVGLNGPGSLKGLAEKYGKRLDPFQWVAKQYEHTNRFVNLGFKHHAIAAALPDRMRWLRRAKKEKA